MANSIETHFGPLPDPRCNRGKRHKLSDMIVIAVTAVICCADSWSDVADFGLAKRKWFETFLDLPHGIASQDTFERVFARLDPDAFERCFMDWAAALAGSSKGKLVAIDGKKIRRSFQHAWDHSTAAHLVSAFVGENATVLGQLAVDCKENEIVAIPRLLDLLDLGGATVTIASRIGDIHQYCLFRLIPPSSPGHFPISPFASPALAARPQHAISTNSKSLLICSPKNNSARIFANHVQSFHPPDPCIGRDTFFDRDSLTQGKP
jgi:hypothetical protein